MKRVIFVFLVLVLVFGMFVVNTPNTVGAVQPTFTPTSIVNQSIAVQPLAPSTWTVGVETSVVIEEYPVPNGLQFMANPVKVTTPEKVCHEFSGGQFNWIPEIKQFKNGKWVKVESTAGWTPNTEGKYMVCFEAEAGKYALFGYYKSPAK